LQGDRRGGRSGGRCRGSLCGGVCGCFVLVGTAGKPDKQGGRQQQGQNEFCGFLHRCTPHFLFALIVADLAGKTLYIVSDAPTRLRIHNLSREIGDTIYIQEEKTYGAEQLIMMVATGEIDLAVCDKAIAQQMSKDYPQIDCNTDISFTQFQSWALRKDDSILLDSLNKWISEIQKEDKYKKLYNSYF
jgi:ABC-type amino acid transport substrate-binding protein